MKTKTFLKSLYLILIILNIYINSAFANTYTAVFENPNPKPSKITSSQLKCPKMKILLGCEKTDQCKVDSDCKGYGVDQKCCYRVGCGMKCVHGTTF